LIVESERDVLLQASASFRGEAASKVCGDDILRQDNICPPLPFHANANEGENKKVMHAVKSNPFEMLERATIFLSRGSLISVVRYSLMVGKCDVRECHVTVNIIPLLLILDFADCSFTDLGSFARSSRDSTGRLQSSQE
jgi:hypothetical protein